MEVVSVESRVRLEAGNTAVLGNRAVSTAFTEMDIAVGVGQCSAVNRERARRAAVLTDSDVVIDAQRAAAESVVAHRGAIDANPQGVTERDAAAVLVESSIPGVSDDQ